MTRRHGWAPRGERLIAKVPHGHWKTATFLAALRNDRLDAPCLFDCPINGERFRAYVEQFLVPALEPGDVVVLDRLVLSLGFAIVGGCRVLEEGTRASGFMALPAEASLVARLHEIKIDKITIEP
jgi:hypothetical protein